MNETTNHIIAKVNWDTSFNWKEKAVELQDRLSAWSKIKMPRNINAVFDKFCPAAQTWKIETLEIDLGKIDFSNLEAELNQQINAQLSQKLIDLVINGNRDHLKIDIQDHTTSQLYLLRYFLVHGLMPWSYQENNGSIQMLFDEQLKNNLPMVIELLREIGTTNLEVRQRIAWQLEEKHIKTIIGGLEPNHHEQIIDFSKEMIKIKAKENSIQGNSLDFKKNLWLWILNYLLTERGTIFNKIAFMKSNIKQMADHYNVTYQDFLMLLEMAVCQVGLKNLIKHGFIAIIKTLVAEEKILRKKTEVKKVTEINEWSLLKKYISAQRQQDSKAQQSEFNDLVVGLAKADQEKFAALILSLGKNGKWIDRVAAALNDSSLIALFVALNPAKADQLIKQLQFLAQLNEEINLQIDRRVIWEIGLKFLQIHHHGSFSNASFYGYYLDQLSKKSGWKKQQIVKSLMTTRISSSIKTISNLTTYVHFIATMAENSAIKKGSITSFSIIDSLVDHWTAYPTDPKKLELLKSEWIKNIQQNPKLTLTALIKYAKINKLGQHFIEDLDRGSIVSLLKNAASEKVAIFTLLQELTDRFKKEQPGFATWINENIYRFGLKAVVFYPALRSTKLINFILLNLSNALTPGYFNYFEQFVLLLSQETPVGAEHISPLFYRNKKQYIFQQVAILMDTASHKKEVGTLLADGLINKYFSFEDLQKHSKKEKIANYLVRNGNSILLLLQKKYTKIFIGQLPKTKLTAALKLMDELLWKCLTAYKNHHGNQEQFEKLFKDAIAYHLNIGLSTSGNAGHLKIDDQQRKLISLKSGQSINEKLLFALIEDCLSKGTGQITNLGATFNLSDLIIDALVLDAGRFKKIWTNLILTKNRINLLEEAISFEVFGLWMIMAGNNKANDEVKALHSWFKLTVYLLAETMPKAIIDSFWKHLWKIEKSGQISTSALKRFVQEILFKITVVRPMNSTTMLSEIRKSGITIPTLLANILVQSMPNFSAESEIEQKEVAKRLTKLKTTGLLTQFIRQLVVNQQAPAWFAVTGAEEIKELLNEIIADHPVQFFLVLRQENLSTAQLKWLNETVHFSTLIKTICHLNSAQSTLLQMVEHFYFSVIKFKNPDVSVKEVQFLLFKKLLNAWLHGNWKIISAENIWHELIWEICVQKGISQVKIIQGFSQIKLQLPPALQITFGQLLDQQQRLKTAEKKQVRKETVSKPFFDDDELLKDSIFVENAGLVLINQYIPMLFERLGLTKNNEYLLDKQLDAVHYLQFVATGQMQSPEPALALNKVLCGVPLNQPIKNEILMSQDEIELVEKLVTAMIGYWVAIGSSSIDGFRGNWLLRDGLLIEYDDKWELTIEKRAYDLLIHKSPFTFSIIKYPWMHKPLYVKWPH